MESVSDEIVAEVAYRTPGFTGWQQERWFTHCAAGEFLGRGRPRRAYGLVASHLTDEHMGPVFSIIFGAILGCIFLVVFEALVIHDRRTGN